MSVFNDKVTDKLSFNIIYNIYQCYTEQGKIHSLKISAEAGCDGDSFTTNAIQKKVFLKSKT